MDSQQIDHIISKKITGSLSIGEQEILDSWIAQSSENKKEFEAYINLWEKSRELVLSDAINIESSLTNTKNKIASLNTGTLWIVYFRQAAAVLLLSLAINFLYNYIKNGEHPEQMVYQEIKVSYGTQTNVVLTDGTKVWLNSGSTLRFPASFKNATEREVDLNGEGFFEVTKNKTLPFIVNTSKLDVKVYGTSFNISTYDDYKSMTVALTEGKISLLKRKGGKEKELLVLKPNEVANYDIAENKLEHSSDNYIEKYTAWKDGKIIFYGDPIDVVIKRLEKWYNVKIAISDDELQNYRFTATFIDESLEQVLKLLCRSSPMEYKITPSQKHKDNTFSKRKVILSVKK